MPASGSNVVKLPSLTFSVGAADRNKLCCAPFPSLLSVSITVCFILRQDSVGESLKAAILRCSVYSDIADSDSADKMRVGSEALRLMI